MNISSGPNGPDSQCRDTTVRTLRLGAMNNAIWKRFISRKGAKDARGEYDGIG
ncbi:MAG: hypothetical protein HW419_3114 [Deltaproteobacteria bacterium]|nr:hypothetical protein [Deltaproteobacteria bacterium]